MAASTPTSAPLGDASLDALSNDFLRHLLAASRGVKSAAKGPDQCLVARAQLVQREVERLQADMVLSLEDAHETASVLADSAEFTQQDALSAHAVVGSLEALLAHLRELETFFTPHQTEGLARLGELEREAFAALDARLLVLVSVLRDISADDLARLELFEEVHGLRDIKATVFAACAQAHRVFDIDRDLESWCSM